MKLIIISDAHQNEDAIKKIINIYKDRVDVFLCAGDSCLPSYSIFPFISIFFVLNIESSNIFCNSLFASPFSSNILTFLNSSSLYVPKLIFLLHQTYRTLKILLIYTFLPILYNFLFEQHIVYLHN